MNARPNNYKTAAKTAALKRKTSGVEKAVRTITDIDGVGASKAPSLR